MYVLLTSIMIISIFNVPLGQPIFASTVYPNRELCENYKISFLQTYPYKLSMEHVAVAQAECMSQEEFFELQNQSRGLAPPTE